MSCSFSLLIVRVACMTIPTWRATPKKKSSSQKESAGKFEGSRANVGVRPCFFLCREALLRVAQMCDHKVTANFVELTSSTFLQDFMKVISDSALEANMSACDTAT